MRTIWLAALSAFLAAGLAGAQQQATGDVAERVTKEILDIEQQKGNCFSSVGQLAGWSADWFKWHVADGEIHYTDRLRGKEEVMDELRTGMRRNINNVQYNNIVRVYGDGEDGTLAVVTNQSDSNIIELYGIRHVSKGTGLGIDIWYRQAGRWWFIAHTPHGGGSAGKPVAQ